MVKTQHGLMNTLDRSVVGASEDEGHAGPDFSISVQVQRWSPNTVSA